ncbi:TadE/TadG family type IV pilus assembly protein [Lentzea sp. JNUCC 0626]|uniref:TadE/TadG family type IV pilus assembly protein n=1 Tax=Lentzea sp. JNUCC 0626 TaxID=3367513 RepID=UPI003748C194
MGVRSARRGFWSRRTVHEPRCRRFQVRKTGSRNDRGSAAAEFVLLVPLLIGLCLAVAAGGSLVSTKLRVNDAAHQTARAASISRDLADVEGLSVATGALSAAGVQCGSLEVAVDGDFHPGGTITATVSCTVDIVGSDLLGIGRAHTITATGSSVVDRYRQAGTS